MANHHRLYIRVGQSEGDIVGDDNRALQAAVDYVASLGGGTVEIGPGIYRMHDALHLRDRVTVRGFKDQTILEKAGGRRTPLLTDGDYGEEQITLEDPSGFEVGGGVTVFKGHPDGFETTVATMIGRIDERTFLLNRPLFSDCQIKDDAYAQTTFPVISGYHLEDVRIEDLTIRGNRENNPFLGGCRGGGVYFYRVHRARVSRVTVLEYNGDGISYQHCDDVTVEDCLIERCFGNGMHPGSGSSRSIVRRCKSVDNGWSGIYVCWRVRHSRFEENELNENGLAGISIGHKDTDNRFERNVIKSNGRYGVLFRDEVRVLAAHRNRFDENVIMDNGNEKEGVGVMIQGETEDIAFLRNTITDSREGASKTQRYGIYVGKGVSDIYLEANRIYGHSNADVFRETS